MHPAGPHTRSPRHTVLLTFDVDSFTSWIGDLGQTNPGPLSRGDFSPIATRRVLRLLAAAHVKATFFVPGQAAATFPALVEDIAAAGHEVAAHGWWHERPATLTRDHERRLLDLALDALTKITGQPPRGHRAPGWDPSRDTAALLSDVGLRYDSSLMGDDYSPYWLRTGDSWGDTSPYRPGDVLNVVELPVAWHLDDVPYFEFVATAGTTLSGLRSPTDVATIWRDELNQQARQTLDTTLVFTMHPETIARGARIRVLEQLLDAVTTLPTAARRCTDHADDWSATTSPCLPDEYRRSAAWRSSRSAGPNGGAAGTPAPL